jgi:hypothetical protein
MVVDMGFDIVLLLVVVGGIGLSAAYVRAEYIRWREHGATQRRRETSRRELHAASLSDQQNAALLPSVLRLQEFGNDEAANPEASLNIEAGSRSAAPSNSPRTDPFSERRNRDRQRANQ